MVIGTGLVARAFSTLDGDNGVNVFASGVSNSGELRASAFQRELNLLEGWLGRPGRLIYFSTCSLFDPTQQDSPYILHKKRLEEQVRLAHGDHLIIRLPNLVGRSNNPHTLINFMRDHILHGEPIDLYMGACRYLLGVDEMVAEVLPLIKDPLLKERTLNVCPEDPVTLPRLITLMEGVLNRVAVVRPLDRGSCYKVDTEAYRAYRAGAGRPPLQVDVEALLRKYVMAV